MAKTPHTTKGQVPPREQEPPARKEAAPPGRDRAASKVDLIEIRTGLFLNVDQIVSIRVLPEEDDNVYAILQLSNGDKLNLTSDEFTAISGEEPRLSMRMRHRRAAE